MWRWTRRCLLFLLVGSMCPPSQSVADPPSADATPDDSPKATPFRAIPIPDLLRQIGGRRQRISTFSAANSDNEPATANPRASGAKDYIDARAPRDLPSEAIWDTARTALNGGDWKRGVEWLQKLLDMPGDALIRTGNDRWESLRTVAQARLNAAPRDVRADYQRQYSGLAQQLLTEAQRSGSTDKLVEVATRFLHTRAGAEAANILAARHLDREELTLSLRWFRELDAAGAEVSRDPRWRMKAAVVARHVDPAAVAVFLDPLLTPTPRSIEVAGKLMSARELWDSLPSLGTSSEPELTDWRQLHGTAARVGIAPAGDPLLQPVWSLPLTDHPGIRARIDELLRDLEDESRTMILAASPIAVGDRVAFRDLRGVRVVSTRTGKVLWRTIAGLSPEQVLAGQPQLEAGNNSAWRFAVQRGGLDDAFFGETAEYHPLANLLFRDATLGLLSSDGDQLFALEDVAVLTRSQAGYQWDADTDIEDPFGALWNCNRLTSYDLATGRVRWSVGGVATEEVAQPSLANAFFLGAPVVVDDELYVVATQGEEIRLWALESLTGRPRWSQLLAYSDTKIDLDIVRRWLSAPIAAGQGIVVCPTTAGWLVAIDRTRRSLLWAYRYLPPVEDRHVDPGAQFLPQQGLNDQWSAGCPILSGQSVVFAPPDGDELVCLNLTNGELRWKHPRGEGVFVGSVHAGQVLVVETQGVVAYALNSGDTLWKCEWDASLRPSGRGVISGGRYVVPLTSRELAAIDLKSGKIAQRWPLPDGQFNLGNLIKSEGRWIALGPHGSVAFGERNHLLDDIAARLQRDPHDSEALLRDVELHVLDRDYAGAEQRLRRLNAVLGGDAEQRRRAAWWQVLSHRVAQDHSEEALDELARYARSPEDRLLIDGWRADHLAAKGDVWPAFQQLWRTAHEDGPKSITRPDAPDVRVQRRAWLAGRLADLWARASDDSRRKIDEYLVASISQSGPLSRAERTRLAELCDFHPAGARLWWQIANDYATLGDLARAETILAHVSEHADHAVATESSLRLAKLWMQFGLGEDARPQLHRLASRTQTIALSDGRPLHDAARQLLSELPVDAATVAGPLAHRVVKWEAHSAPTSHAPQLQSLVPPLATPSWQRLSMQIEPQEQRVTFQSRNSDRWQWLAPLKMNPRGDDPQVVPAEFVDHRLWVLSRDVLHFLSPFERKTVWTRSLDLPTDSLVGPTSQPPAPTTLYGPDDHDTALHTWPRWSDAHGQLAVANRRYLCVVGRREITVLDPLTGAELWRKTGVPPLANVFGGDDVVFIFNQQREPAHAEAYRATDGKPLTIPKLAERISRALQVRGNDLILLEQQRFLGLDLFASKMVLRRWNPLTNDDAWKLELPARSHVGMAGDEFAIAVGPPSAKDPKSRDVEWIDLETGSRHRLAAATLEAGGSGFIPLLDADRIYLIAYTFAGPGYHYGDSLNSLPVHGRIVAWDRRTGKLLWQREVTDQHLVLDRFAQSPALVFVTRSWKEQGNSHFTSLSLLALDKQTGAVLYESTAPSALSGFHSLLVRAWEPSVELQSYNLRLRLSPATR